MEKTVKVFKRTRLVKEVIEHVVEAKAGTKAWEFYEAIGPIPAGGKLTHDVVLVFQEGK